MATTFKASLGIRFAIHNYRLPTNTALEFTRSQIFFPKSFFNGHYESINVKDGMHYELIVHNNTILNKRYEIKLDNHERIRLAISRENEERLKQVHGLTWRKKHPVYKIFKFAIIAIFSVLIGLLRMKEKKLSLYKRRKAIFLVKSPGVKKLVYSHEHTK